MSALLFFKSLAWSLFIFFPDYNKRTISFMVPFSSWHLNLTKRRRPELRWSRLSLAIPDLQKEALLLDYGERLQHKLWPITHWIFRLGHDLALLEFGDTTKLCNVGSKILLYWRSNWNVAFCFKSKKHQLFQLPNWKKPQVVTLDSCSLTAAKVLDTNTTLAAVN